MKQHVTQLEIEITPGSSLSTEARDEAIKLCSRAYKMDFGPVMDTFRDTIHILGRADSMLVSHALWVTRWLQIEENPPMRTAYVEAVATEPQFQRKGYASAIMERIIQEVQNDYDLGALSPTSAAYYQRLGWELWQGPLSIRTDKGLEQSPDHEEVMIYRLPQTPELDIETPLSAEWREGELW